MIFTNNIKYYCYVSCTLHVVPEKLPKAGWNKRAGHDKGRFHIVNLTIIDSYFRTRSETTLLICPRFINSFFPP